MAPIGFRHHLGLKFLSLALAALLWLVVSGEQVAERVLRVPLEFTNLPSALELVGDAPGQVDVRVRGSSGAVSRINAGDLVAVVDLRSARPGRRLFHVAGDDVRRPFGVDVVQVNPGSVAMTFERSAAKVVPVVPGIDGEPASGFTVGAVTSEPSTVEVVGPESALKRLTEAITEPVSVDGATAPRSELVTVGLASGLSLLVFGGTALGLLAGGVLGGIPYTLAVWRMREELELPVLFQGFARRSRPTATPTPNAAP